MERGSRYVGRRGHLIVRSRVAVAWLHMSGRMQWPCALIT